MICYKNICRNVIYISLFFNKTEKISIQITKSKCWVHTHQNVSPRSIFTWLAWHFDLFNTCLVCIIIAFMFFIMILKTGPETKSDLPPIPLFLVIFGIGSNWHLTPSWTLSWTGWFGPVFKQCSSFNYGIEFCSFSIIIVIYLKTSTPSIVMLFMSKSPSLTTILTTVQNVNMFFIIQNLLFSLSNHIHMYRC